MFSRILAATILAAPLTHATAHEERVQVEIDVVEDDAGDWTVTYTFAQPQKALVLAQAPVTYRDWKPLSDGASMWRIGKMEGFAFAEPRTSASFKITPHTGNLPAAYTPFLKFSDGGYGVLTGQFTVKPIADLNEAAAYDATGQDWPAPVLASAVSLRSPRLVSPYEGHPAAGNGTYVYVGDPKPIEGANFAGYVDPGIPDWLSASFDDDMGVIFGKLSSGWGIDLPEKARILMIYKGAEDEGLHLGGGAMESLLSLEMGGSDLTNPIPEIRTYVRWFLAHEAAHLFQNARGDSNVLFSGDEAAWVHEGSANTFSHNIGARLAEDPQGFLDEVYRDEHRDCVAHLSNASLDQATRMQNFRASYACGNLIALATDAALPQHDLYDFWNALQTASLTTKGMDRASLYFSVLADLGARDADIAILKQFVSEKPEDAGTFIREAMNHFGLPVTLDAEGEFVSLQLRSPSDGKALFDQAGV